MAGSNRTDDPRYGFVFIYMDADTRFDATEHPVTDSLGLSAGDPLDTPAFPCLPGT